MGMPKRDLLGITMAVIHAAEAIDLVVVNP